MSGCGRNTIKLPPCLCGSALQKGCVLGLWTLRTGIMDDPQLTVERVRGRGRESVLTTIAHTQIHDKGSTL